MGLVFSILILCSLYFAFRHLRQDEENIEAIDIRVSLLGFICIVAISAIWVYMSGIGGFVWQRADWHARNALMHDLIDNSWPVIFEDGGGLVYYLCFWMIPAWLGAVLFLNERKKNKTGKYCLIAMLLIPFTPFAAVGICPLLLADVIVQRFKGCLTFENFFSALSILPVFASYYMCNNALEGTGVKSGIGIFKLDNKGIIYNIVVLVVFLTVEVIIYTILIWKRNRHDYMFLTNFVWLLIIPVIRIGPTRDFVMRGSIIPMFVLMFYVIETLFDNEYRKNKFLYAALISSVMIGFYAGAGDFVVTVKNTLNPEVTNVSDAVGSMNNNDNEEWNAYMNGTSYIVKNAREKYFWRIFAK